MRPYVNHCFAKRAKQHDDNYTISDVRKLEQSGLRSGSGGWLNYLNGVGNERKGI